jgi:flagellar motor switch protein FliM
MDLTAQWPGMKITTRELLALKPGEILDLKPEHSDKIEIRLGSLVKFKARLGTRENKWAFQITEICKTP